MINTHKYKSESIFIRIKEEEKKLEDFCTKINSKYNRQIGSSHHQRR